MSDLGMILDGKKGTKRATLIPVESSQTSTVATASWSFPMKRNWQAPRERGQQLTSQKQAFQEELPSINA
jgi:hypothetical protein